MELITDLPEIFEEFAEKRKQSFLKVKEYKEEGKPIIGAYCSYFPRELAIAIGAIPIGLCSSSHETVEEAENVLPANICPLIKSSYGFAVTDKCPYFHFSDLVVGEMTCDGKKKMYELMADFKEVYVMELPHRQSETGLKYWKQEIINFKEYLEEKFQTIITDEMLLRAIKISNANRQAVKEFYGLMQLDPPPMSGMELFQVIYGSKYNLDLQEATKEINALRERVLVEYEEHIKKEKRKKPRLLITGCPIGGDSCKIIKAIENNGGTVVAFENCTGAKAIERMIDESNPDLYQAIAERYFSIGCSIMSPNDNRIFLLGQMIDDYKVDGVIDMTLSGCHSNSIESVSIGHFIKEEKNIPYMQVVTDYSGADFAQLNTRMTAFIEML